MMWLVVYLGPFFTLQKLTDRCPPNALYQTAPNTFDDEIYITVHVSTAIITSTSIMQFIITIESVINL